MGCGGCLILVRTCLFAVTLNVWHPTFVQRCPLLLMRREKWKQQRPQSGYRTCAAMELTNDTMRMCGQGMPNSFRSHVGIWPWAGWLVRLHYHVFRLRRFTSFCGVQFASLFHRLRLGLGKGG